MYVITAAKTYTYFEKGQLHKEDHTVIFTDASWYLVQEKLYDRAHSRAASKYAKEVWDVLKHYTWEEVCTKFLAEDGYDIIYNHFSLKNLIIAELENLDEGELTAISSPYEVFSVEMFPLENIDDED